MRVLHVNVGRARPIAGGGVSAIGKRPVSGDVAVGALGLEGDEQADPSVHGGLSKAVYAYPQEHYAFWQTVRAQAGAAGWDESLPPGAMGENLTLAGLTEERLWIGDRLYVGGRGPGDEAAPAGSATGGCVLAVSEPRMPCHKFNVVMGFAQAGKLMAQSGYCGAYLAVVRPGTVRAGDPVVLLPGPREVNLRELFKARMGRR